MKHCLEYLLSQLYGWVNPYNRRFSSVDQMTSFEVQAKQDQWGQNCMDFQVIQLLFVSFLNRRKMLILFLQCTIQLKQNEDIYKPDFTLLKLKMGVLTFWSWNVQIIPPTDGLNGGLRWFCMILNTLILMLSSCTRASVEIPSFSD